MAARAAERALEHEGDLGFDLGVDEFAGLDLAAVWHGAVLGHEAEHGRAHAHLLHLGERGEAGLEARELEAARLLAHQDGGLDRVGVFPVHAGKVVGDLVGVAGLELAVLQVLGEGGDGGLVECHGGLLRGFS
ncbi:hypothetical protein FQZ97_1054210 [compost metagenome]